MQNLLLTYAQKTPVSSLRLIQDPGSWGFVLETGMVSHHHGLSVLQLVAGKRLRLVKFRRQVVSARGRVVPLLHHLNVLLVLMLVLLLLLRMRMLLRMWLGVVVGWRVMLNCVHAHRRRDGDILRHNRGRAFVYGDRSHRDTRRRVELVVGRRGLWVVWLLCQEVLIVSVRDRDRHRGLLLIRVLRGGIFRGRSS